jgi:hypothetical protein
MVFQTPQRSGVVLVSIRNCFSALGIWWLFLDGSGPAAAADGNIRATYELSFLGVTLTVVNLDIAVRNSVYTARIDYQASGVARVASDASGQAISRGAYRNGHFIPATFVLDRRGGERPQKVALAISGGDVKTMTLDPPSGSLPDRTPIEPEHLKHVIDPLSAFLVPAVRADGKTAADVCDRTLPIFDGLRRYDVALSSIDGTNSFNVGGFAGPTKDCQVRWTLIAGQTRDGQGSSPAFQPHDIVVTFGLVKTVEVFVPLLISARTSYGTVQVRLTQFVGPEKISSDR